MNKQKILITGGAGFVGSHLADKLIDKGRKVVVIDNLSTGSRENVNPEAQFYNLDIVDKKLRQVFKKEKPEVVFHLAAQINARRSVTEPVYDARTNILGSLNLLECIFSDVKPAEVGFTQRSFQRLSAAPKLVFASSGGTVYGEPQEFPTPESHPLRPNSPYGVAKVAFEKYMAAYKDLDWLSLRLGNVYGPRQNTEAEAGVVAIFTENLLGGKKCTIFGDGKQTRDYVYIDDAVEAFIKAMKTDSTEWDVSKRAINIGTGKETSVNKIYQLVRNEVFKDTEEVEVEPVHEEGRPGDIRRSGLQIKKAHKLLGWKPRVSLKEGIKRTVEWFKERGITQKSTQNTPNL